MKKTLFTLFALALPMLASAEDDLTKDGIIYELGGKGTTKVAKVKGTTEALQATKVLEIPATVSDGTSTYTVTTILSGSLSGTNKKVYVDNADIEWIDGKPYYNGQDLIQENVNSYYYEVWHDPDEDPSGMGMSWNETVYVDESDVEWIDGMPSYNGNNLMQTISGYRYYYYQGQEWTTVKIPATITTIQEYACTMGSITTLDVADLAAWCSVNITSSSSGPSQIWTYINPTNFCVNGTKVTDLVIPSTVTSISNSLFMNYGCFTSVSIPGTVQTIGSFAFQGCNFSTLALSEGLQTIGEQAFSNNSNLTAVTVPQSVNYTGSYVFAYCSNLASATINGSMGGYMFMGCSKLTTVTFGENVSQIHDYVFSETSISDIVIPSTVSTISYYAFNNCPKLETVTIKREVDAMGMSNGLSIGGYAFSNCPLLADFYCEVPFSNVYVDDYSASTVFENSKVDEGATLHVPAGDVASYQSTMPWSQFTNVVALSGTTPDPDPVIPDDFTASIGSLGMSTLYSEYPLDFSGVTGLKAYIVSAFTPSTGHVIMTQVSDVPAKTGVVLIGSAGDYTIPTTTTKTYVANLLKGVSESTVMWKTDGKYTNYILANGSSGVGFYAVKDGSTLAGGKAYLAIPTESFSAAPSFVMMDIDGVTGIENIENSAADVTGKAIYNLNGQRQSGLKKGINIVGGKKMVVK